MRFRKTREERQEEAERSRQFWARLRPRGTVLENISGPTGDVDIDYDSEELMAAAEACRRK